MIVFGVGAPEVEVAFVANDKGWCAASDGMLGQFLEGGVPEPADGMPGFKVGPNEVTPLASDGVGGVVYRLLGNCFWREGWRAAREAEPVEQELFSP